LNVEAGKIDVAVTLTTVVPSATTWNYQAVLYLSVLCVRYLLACYSSPAWPL